MSTIDGIVMIALKNLYDEYIEQPKLILQKKNTGWAYSFTASLGFRHLFYSVFVLQINANLPLTGIVGDCGPSVEKIKAIRPAEICLKDTRGFCYQQ